MKYSFCTIAWRHKNLSLDDMIYIIGSMGYDGLEIWSKHFCGFEASITYIKKLLNLHHLAVPMISPYFDFTSSIKRWRESIIESEKFICIANELNCGLIRCFTGKIGSGYANSKEWKQGVEGIQSIAEKAQQKNIKIAIETHVDTLADTIESTKKLISDINMNNVGIVLDFFNLYENEDGLSPLKLIDELYPYTLHVHAKNAIKNLGRISPFNFVMGKGNDIDGIRNLDSGDLNYEEILKELQARKYPGFVSIESFETKRNPIGIAKEEIAYLKKLI